MAIEQQPRRPGSVRYTLLSLSLAVLGAGMLIVIVHATGAAQQAEGPERRYWRYLAGTAMVLLGIVLVALVWMFTRFMAFRAGAQDRHERTVTPHVNAWEIAGKRFQLPKKKKGRGKGRQG